MQIYYNINVIITYISMEGGEIVRFLLDIIFAIIVQVSGDFLYKWLDKTSPSGSWKTLHGVVKRSLIRKDDN